MDISGLSLKELEALQISVANEIVKRKQSSKADALKKARQAAQEMGFTLEELLGAGGKAPRSGKPVAIKYRHPANPAQTWTGRGKTPRWVVEWKSANGSLDAITVK